MCDGARDVQDKNADNDDAAHQGSLDRPDFFDGRRQPEKCLRGWIPVGSKVHIRFHGRGCSIRRSSYEKALSTRISTLNRSRTIRTNLETDRIGYVAASRFAATRDFSTSLVDPLLVEDQVVQSMEDASPVKWHLAHTTWFFETFLLAGFVDGYTPHDPRYSYLFNSYYVQAGDRFSRPHRGLLTRPSVEEVGKYRAVIDERVADLLTSLTGDHLREACAIVELGLNHEQQHQELILTDVKHLLSCNPLQPAYATRTGDPELSSARPVRFNTIEPGVYEVGYAGQEFSFDNEGPRHRVFLEQVEIADRLVTNGEYREFIADGGYRRPELWLSAGWVTAEADGWTAPLYWREQEGQWMNFTLFGLEPVQDAAPVCHVSYFEADAFARWAGCRLPTEFDWEVAAGEVDEAGNFVEAAALHPLPSGQGRQFFGDAWEWTRSAYAPYPGYRAAEGALGEYNGKFMANQFVLRGGSVATSRTHIRRTYRNFFHPAARWQFSGIRLARDPG